jgi:sugar lactone lactonase YvrE
VISLSPGDVIHAIAGTGAIGFSGDNGPASSAVFAFPSSMAMDSAGNLYIADTDNHRIRRIDVQGNITTIAGTGEQGFFGDNGPATSAALNRPRGVAVDSAGNLYIADSENNCVRLVAGGTITTFAGTGVAGFSGDGGSATSAMLNLPVAVAVDSTRNVYIVDANNHRVRQVSAGKISTLAGNGEQGFSGDGGPATSASLNGPAAVTVDASGNLYVADSENHRVRKVSGGTINTVAGTGVAGFSGDTGPATSAAMNLPLGVSMDASGSLYIADSKNQVVRRLNADGTMSSVAATGEQGFFGDNGPPTAAVLDTPSGILPMNGSLYIADRNNQRIRLVDATALAFANTVVGTASPVGTVTVKNVGGGQLTLASVAPSSASFALAGSGSCGTTFPHDIAAGSSCTLDMIFDPASVGVLTGSLSISDNAGGSPHSINVVGTGIQDGTSLALTSSLPTSNPGQSVTLTATLTPQVKTTAPPPTGIVVFAEGSSNLATQPVNGGAAAFSTSSLTSGTHVITATYSGDSLYASSSGTVSQTVNISDYTVAATPASQTIHGGQTATYSISATAQGGFTGQLSLACSNLPQFAACNFNPPVITVNGNSASSILTITTTTVQARLDRPEGQQSSALYASFWLNGLGLFGLVLLSRQSNRQSRFFFAWLLLLLGTAGIGCSKGKSASQTPVGNYAVSVTAQPSGSSQKSHAVNVTLNIVP